jgi:putative hydrolase of the HAD superfamily
MAQAGSHVTVSAVVFDFYGTLAETRDWGPSWEQLIEEMGYALDPDVKDRWWNDGIDGIEHDEHSRSRDHYVAWQQARVRSMLDAYRIPACDQDILIARVREIGGHRRIEAYDEVIDVLAELRAAGFALAICSNWDWDLLEALESAGINDAVDVTVSSAWVGARKPHPRIFRHTVDRLGIAPEETLFVGDTWTCDVDGPRAAGLRPVYLRRPHFGPDHTAPTDHHEQDDVHRAHDLRAVLDLVGDGAVS